MEIINFKEDTNYIFNAIIAQRDANGRFSIVAKFNLRVRTDPKKGIESISVFENNLKFEVVSRALYDATDDLWCYPSARSNNDRKSPSEMLVKLVESIKNAAKNGHICVQGDNLYGLMTLMNNDKQFLSEIPKHTTKTLFFASPE